MTDDCMGCREPGYSHAAYCPESRVEDLRKQLADSERLREDERLTWDAQHKRQASVNAHLAALVTDAQEELRKCQQDAIQLQARLAEVEAERDKILRLWLDDADPAECGYAADSAEAALCKYCHGTGTMRVIHSAHDEEFAPCWCVTDSASHRENERE